jgi:PPK2 family polyphosphate:nucleotide phosphotransferase
MKSFDHLIPGKKVDLKKIDAASLEHVPERDEADAATAKAAVRIGELQDVMYAEGRRSLLIVLQGMDASGKDGTVRRVFDAVNPEGVSVTSFKTPTSLEARHDFLWRTHAAVPARGNIGIFNRSYYEEVLIVRVHADRFLRPELLERKDLWRDRFSLINDFEHLLMLNGTRVLKFFLHISKDEQRQRFEDRQRDPTKHWKLAAGDFEERKFWGDYQRAYEEMIAGTSTDENPWYIIPANRKWARNYWISQIVKRALEEMKLAYPPASEKGLITRKFS